MSCAQHQELFSELIEGRLDAVRRASVDEHLAVCSTGRELVADLRRIREAAARLPRVTPPDAVWQKISAAIKDDQRTSAAGTGWRTVAAIAAGTVLLVMTVFFAARLLDRGPAEDARVGTIPAEHGSETAAQIAASIEAELRLAEQHYENAIAGLEHMASVEEGLLDPEVAAALRQSIQAVDRAIEESRAALQDEPASRPAQESLFEALRRKVDLLQDTIALVNEMRKGNEAGAARIAAGLDRS